MYSLMIVEDELLARLALKNSISWEKFNIDEIYEAQDGMEAFQKYKKYHPDILIVDINIPFMNGIELIQEIRKTDKKAKVIIVSCLEDFQYAKAAIQANVSQYILKASMSVKEIEEAVSKVLEEIKLEESGSVRRKKPGMEEEYRNKKILLRKLLMQKSGTEDRQGAFKMPACLAVFQVDFEVYRECDLSQEFLNKMNFAKSIIGTTLGEVVSCYVISMEDGRYVVLAEHMEGKAEEELKQLLKNAGGLIEKYTGACVHIGMGKMIYEQSSIPDEFTKIKRKLAYYSFGEDGLSGEKEEEILKRLDKIWNEMIDRMETQIRDVGLPEMAGYIVRIPEFSENYEERIWNYWSRLINTTAVLYEKKTGCRMEEWVAEYIEKLRRTEGLWEKEKVYEDFLERMSHEHENQAQYSELVEKAIEYAEKNCIHPVTLVDAAEELHVSAGYLSTVFSREYGIGYTDFLIRNRIEKAKILLESGNKKMMEIAAKCGFNDQAYFTRTFKKITGMSPNDYRKSVKEHRV